MTILAYRQTLIEEFLWKIIKSLHIVYFPKIQFVASTHSPIPFLGAPKESVFLTVNRSKEEGITIERIKHLKKEIQIPNFALEEKQLLIVSFPVTA